MLYSENLENIVFDRHNSHRADELIVVSGYVGPSPVARVRDLPLNTTVIYGMYGQDKIRKSLHNSLKKLDEEIGNLSILYSNTPVHAKIYLWKYRGEISHVLVGSANFSANGLRTDFREILAEATIDTYAALDTYLNSVLRNSIACSAIDALEELEDEIPVSFVDPTKGITCKMTLLDPRTGLVPERSGINWGQSPRAHVRPNDAYIPIRKAHLTSCSKLFSPKTALPLLTAGRGRRTRQNDYVEFIWDDGIHFEGLFEGTQNHKGDNYPKNISSYPVKSTLGEYIRNRIGVPSGQMVTLEHLTAYGRTDIEISLEGERIYYLDFSV